MSRFLPRSLIGQMLLAVAIALLLAQGLGAFLLYRAQDQMRENALVHAAAFRLITASRNAETVPRLEQGRQHRPPGLRRGRHGIPVEASMVTPLRTGEMRLNGAEARLKHVLADQSFDAAEIVVVIRPVADDPVGAAYVARHGPLFGRLNRQRVTNLLVAGVKFEGRDRWTIARIRAPERRMDLARPLILQTLLIYLVLIGAVALILRRISRPLAALTSRVERFAQTRDAHDQLEPEGPDDIRKLIEAHNAMEARICAMLDEKDVMLGAIGHDLKTPLAALRVRIESVPDETERHRMAATIEDIVRTLDDILSLARVGRSGDPAEQCELAALVASVVEEYEDMGKPAELGETERIVLNLRPTWLRRALRNLIDNAIRYGNGARVSLSRENGQAIVRIDDDGPGIPEDEIDAMTNAFTRGDPSRNSATGGAGLGLALARAIAEQHGGSLHLHNRAEGGLRAEIRLPCNS